ncbi:pirin family protein [Flexithrix dorotheae]|uniref:pirin family protein n=1 Tax=Flexithrix dorotheae TaxID=70993 RepID=UPI0003A3AC46|nr:pirin family protein [Flexithrix dorotheae]
MKTIIHKAETRGHANHGWLDSHHTFSFANYYDPERVHFGTLRVLNDDIVEGGMGFGKHPHDNMEIISIPLSGDLEHKDSMGNTAVIRENDVQVMSAGTGIFHSEYNKNKDSKVNFLQIWVFPKERNIKPRYDQKTYDPKDRTNRFQTVVSPTDPEAVSINQDAYFSLGNFTSGQKTNYKISSPENGAYFFLLEGKIKIGQETLEKRDGIGIWDASTLEIEILEDAEILVMDVPMKN